MRWALVIASLCWASSAVAQAQPQAPAPPVRKDPKGVTGVSPYWEKIAQGDGAAVARDFDAAVAAYRAAIAQEANNPLGHYRVAQAFVLKGDLKEAELAYTAALRFAGADGTMKAKILFCLADLRERQKNTDEAIARWSEYEAHAKSDEKAKTYPASGAERRKRNEDWKKLSAESAEVKLRTEKRMKEVEAAATKRTK